jgi:hypothetical protein
VRLRIPNPGIAALFSVALLASLGPHLFTAGFKLAGGRPPAALVFICPLHNLGADTSWSRPATDGRG